MTSTFVPIRREAGKAGDHHVGADIQREAVPPQMGPPEHRHARSDEGFLVVKRRHTGKEKMIEARLAWMTDPCQAQKACSCEERLLHSSEEHMPHEETGA